MNDGAVHIICVGASHQTASLAVRERFAIAGERGRELCEQLRAHAAVLEVAPLATCNRSELYIATHDPAAAADAALEAFSQLAGSDDRQELETMLVVRRGLDAAEHLYRVASGIESVVTGEAQIQGQLRVARETALEAGTSGAVLDRLFRSALQVGKRARTETRIGAGRASIGSVAAELVAGTRGGTLDDALVVVVGAGKMGGLAARSLAARGARRIDVANRSQERAAKIAAECGTEGIGVGFDEIDAELHQADAVVSSTNAPHMVLGAERVAAAMATRPDRPLVLVDLAVPRDIDPACNEIPGVHVFDLDDLERVVAQTLDVRGEEVAAVEALTTEAAREFGQWLRGESATPRIRAMRERAELIRRSRLEQLLGGATHLQAAERERIDLLTRSIVNRSLHAPTMQLRQAAERA